MHLFISVFLAVAPALILVRYFYRLDLKKPEPKGLVTRIFFLGFASTLPVGLFELGLERAMANWIDSFLLFNFIKAFFIAGFIEETVKWLIVIKFVYHHVDFDEQMDGIVYAIVAGLGFACLENVIYVIDGGLNIALARAFTAVPIHAIAAGFMGSYLGQAKFAASPDAEKRLIFTGLAYAVLIHGLYDFFLFASPQIGVFFALGVLPLLVATFFRLKARIKLAIADDFHAGRHNA
ncbi:MAG: PrsW family glutamic-type intramembrane protease [candidate division KSB1 bacterium]|nr:PrsW family glutamic-type intramembrane protease [candidate division KSB1 bacterium]MDZ7317998.1 PrsW family glutamic-type intramembrane protease [candidate division KSB1 bacterium]MDZ7341567.1 PrsW family glutamic-type intramembrane protease [candidate division KSB1 bacterium]